MFLDIDFKYQYNICMSVLLNQKNIAFYINNEPIYWYGIIICCAIIVAIIVATSYCKFKKYDTEMPINIALVVVPVGILSARLFAVLFDNGLTLAEYFNFRSGGMSIIGAVIGGGIGLLIYSLIKKEKNPFIYFDTLVVVLILAQAIGRWGNYFNDEVYGQIIETGSLFARFPFAIKINDTYYQALFFYESVLNLIGFGILSVIYLGKTPRGAASGVYLIYYGTVRTILEQFRQDKYILKYAGLPISRICSALMIVIGIVIIISVLVKSKKSKVKNG